MHKIEYQEHLLCHTSSWHWSQSNKHQVSRAVTLFAHEPVLSLEIFEVTSDQRNRLGTGEASRLSGLQIQSGGNPVPQVSLIHLADRMRARWTVCRGFGGSHQS